MAMTSWTVPDKAFVSDRDVLVGRALILVVDD